MLKSDTKKTRFSCVAQQIPTLEGIYLGTPCEDPIESFGMTKWLD